MSRNRQTGYRRASSFPRVSGDEPAANVKFQEYFEFSPRERG